MSAAEEPGSPAQRGLLLSDLVGKEVRVVFSLPDLQWPIPGRPAWCLLRGVDGGMVCLADRWGPSESADWYSLNIIQSIKEF